MATVAVLLLLGGSGFVAWRQGWLTTAKASAPVPALLNLAVLPFSNTGPPKDEHFAGGVTDEIRGRLARLPGLQVIASASTARYSDSTPLEEGGQRARCRISPHRKGAQGSRHEGEEPGAGQCRVDSGDRTPRHR